MVRMYLDMQKGKGRVPEDESESHGQGNGPLAVFSGFVTAPGKRLDTLP